MDPEMRRLLETIDRGIEPEELPRRLATLADDRVVALLAEALQAEYVQQRRIYGHLATGGPPFDEDVRIYYALTPRGGAVIGKNPSLYED